MIIKNVIDLNVALDLVKNSPILAFDIETTSLNTRTGQVIGYGLSNGIESVYVAHLAWDGDQLVEILNKKEALLILESLKAHHTKLICHNASFDLRFTKNYFGIDLIPELWSDSMLAKHTADEDFPFGLKELASNLWGEDAKEEQSLMKASIKENGGTANQFYKADLDLLARYCMKDCVLTFRINEHYLKELEKQKLTDFFFKDEVMPLYKEVTIPMEMSGVPLDLELLNKTKLELDEDLVALENKVIDLLQPHTSLFEEWYLDKEFPIAKSGSWPQALAEVLQVPLPKTDTGKPSLAAKNVDALSDSLLFKKWYTTELRLPQDLIRKTQRHMNGGVPRVNLSSKHHLKKIFFDTLQETPLSRTPTGLPQVDEEFLESVKDKYEFVPLLMDYNKLVKIKGTYVDRLLEEQENGIWYPSFQQHRTVSGRMGSDAQQLPRKIEDSQASDIVVKYNNLIRNFIIAAPDSILIGADYESLEPKVFAHMSGDENLKNIFRQNKDFYSEIAIRTEGLQGVSSDKAADNFLGKVNKSARQKAKSYSLGVPYGLTGYKLQFEIGVDKDTAESLVERYLDAFPDLRRFMDHSRYEAKIQGWVRSEAGRIRHLNKAKELHDKFGDWLLDSLQLWKEYHESPKQYSYMKEMRKVYSNQLNNSINFKIQSLAASIVNRASIELNRYFKNNNIDACIVLNIHDELVVHCKLAEATKVCYYMKYIMENNYKISIPLVADPVVATIYGETK